ncbi:MAG: GNAT family N-acetyltransferase [Candidatus Cloacimonetes bacterium]|nr:GNAT family N-acetyltransferase [Candidatus Cloacimonadota bacterium]
MKYEITHFDRKVFNDITELWNLAGIGKPTRGDTFEIVQSTISHGAKISGIYVNEKLIATCWITNDWRRLFLHHMAVHPEYQNRGLGARLIEDALDYGKEMELQMKLDVHQDNTVAIHLYTKYGFQPLAGYFQMFRRGFQSWKSK